MFEKNFRFTYPSVPTGVLLRRILGSILLVVAALGIGSGITNIIFDTRLPLFVDGFILQTIGVHLIGMMGIGIGFVYWLERDPVQFMRLQRPSGNAMKYLYESLLGLGLAVVIIAVMFTVTGFSQDRPPIPTVTDTRTALFIVIPTLFFLAGPAEELLFRGVIQSYLGEVSPDLISIGVTTILFTLVHIPTQLWSGAPTVQIILSLVVIALLSVFLGAIYEYADNLWIPSILHGLYNTLVIVSYLAF